MGRGRALAATSCKTQDIKELFRAELRVAVVIVHQVQAENKFTKRRLIVSQLSSLAENNVRQSEQYELLLLLSAYCSSHAGLSASDGDI